MLDIETMRFALGAVSLLVTVLFYLGVFRPTRSTFAGWWTVGLLCSGLSTSLLLFNGTGVQVVTNPASSAASATGATAVWFATRSLRHRRLPVWIVPASVVIVVAAAAVNQPSVNAWAGDGVLFAYMAAMFCAGSIEMWLAWRARGLDRGEPRSMEAQVALLVSALAATTLGLFYTLRWVIYMVAGWQSDLFQDAVGTGVTTAILLLCLVAVTFSASTIGWDQRTSALRRRAITDDLTGLLGRAEFWARARDEVDRGTVAGATPVLILADLDHFKEINDRHGHSAGDAAIVLFARTARDAIVRKEAAGRLGGEEFGLLLRVRDADEARTRVAALARDFAAKGESVDFPVPTASFGIAVPGAGDSLDVLFERADAALYQAKDRGRDQAVVAQELPG